MNHYSNHFGKAGFKGNGLRTAKTILLIMLAICMTLELSSCDGTAKETKENQVKDDVSKFLSQDAAFSGYNLEVNSFSISKRQTNAEDKTDFVWCEITATGNAAKKTDDKFSCSIECQLTYGLYNDGWRLDTCTCDIVTSSVKPLSSPTMEWVEQLAISRFTILPGDQFEVHDMVWKSDTEVVYPVDLHYSERGQNYGLECTKELTFDFTFEKGWTCQR